MSHFIANAISISKDLKTFKVKGGDNNVVPRSNYWSNDMPIEDLYYSFNSGNIDLRSKTEKACFINNLVHNNKFGGDWSSQTDYYHIKGLPKTKEELKKIIDEQEKENLTNGYYINQLECKKNIYNKFEFYRKKLDDFDNQFLQELKHGLKNLSNKKEHAIKLNKIDAYIQKIYRKGCAYTQNINYALRMSKNRAITESKRFDSSDVIDLHLI